MRESSDKRSVEIAKSQKRANVFDFGGYGPVFNACNFGGIHACYPLFDYPQVIDRRGMEGALLRFEVQIMFLCYCKDVFDGSYVVRE